MTNDTNHRFAVGHSALVKTVLLLWSAFVSVPASGVALADDELIGDWSLQMNSGTPAWMSVNQIKGKWDVKMRLYVGPEGPHANVVFANDRLCFTLRQNKRATDSKTVNVGVDNGVLDGVVCTTFQDGTVHHDSFTRPEYRPFP